VTRRAVSVGLAIALVVGGGLVVIGRQERSNEQAYMLDGIADVRAAVGPRLARPGPNNYRLEPGLSCLLYAANGRSYALELCDDAAGRIVQAVDRRGKFASFYSVAVDPQVARIRVDPALFPSLIEKVRREHPRRR
jgi:hypothetical protein